MRFISNGKKLRTRTWWSMMTWCSSVRYKPLTSASQLKSHQCPTSLLLWWCTLATSFSLATMCVTWRETGLATLQMILTSKGVVQLKISMKKPTSRLVFYSVWKRFFWWHDVGSLLKRNKFFLNTEWHWAAACEITKPRNNPSPTWKRPPWRSHGVI